MALWSLVFSVSVWAWGQVLSPQAAQAAFDSHQFQKSLSLWAQLYKKSPQNFSYGLKTAELTFLVEGRKPALALLEKIQEKEKTLTATEKESLKKKKKEFLETFFSEEAQTFTLQAASKIRLKEWPLALSLIQQANTLEASHTQILKLKSEIEKHLGQNSEACSSLRALNDLENSLMEAQEDLLECQIYSGNFEEVKQELSRLKKLSFRQKLALLEANLKTHSLNEAGTVFESLKLENAKILSQSPEYQWLSYQFYSLKKENEKLANQSKKKLLALKAQGSLSENSKWDPYRLIAQLETLTK